MAAQTNLDRRSFLKGSAALAGTPFLPVPSLGATPSLPPQLVLWSEHHAARHGTASAKLFSRQLGVNVDTAKALSDRLIARGLATAPKVIVPKAPSHILDSDLTERLKDTAQSIADVADEACPDTTLSSDLNLAEPEHSNPLK